MTVKKVRVIMRSGHRIFSVIGRDPGPGTVAIMLIGRLSDNNQFIPSEKLATDFKLPPPLMRDEVEEVLQKQRIPITWAGVFGTLNFCDSLCDGADGAILFKRIIFDGTIWKIDDWLGEVVDPRVLSNYLAYYEEEDSTYPTAPPIMSS